ncbi:hypothetical protein HYPSUDRAFT_91058 [Hypholoma sublateritium FD-334 SS-4]|uniref:Cyanovirin-N domain-containing protein n=1 Tax=Hypholoma sublateritium (strain FD-334 SS-4) TaxID=945553 RepID=A0A0D2KQE4_HYPSF|nr:hypothetical protein HYPSUDRAFT_91058 [Hypholoma sublateritium FD-334 SS-4]
MQLTTFAALFVTAFSALKGATAGGFSATCSNIFLPSNNFLQATCGDGHGGETTSELNLNACIGIAATELVCKANGDYAALGCSGCEIVTGEFMECGCPGGALIADLDDCVTNTGGILTC